MTSKQTVAAVREPLARAATAAAPLMRCSDPAVVAATEQLLNALSDVEDTARLGAALEALGRAVQHGHRTAAVLVGASARRLVGMMAVRSAGPQLAAGPRSGQCRVSHHRISSVTAPLPSL
ncbi:hypothetical protein [Streptomyces luteogriseus]|uniref:hypothetical protein n=1 Tax=Streptomyces luteogriseus TaxID=68233 RepID=UPI00382FBD26